MAIDNTYGIARINQEGERLLTVRPRYYATSEDNPRRGEAATMRLILSEGVTSDMITAMSAGMPYYESIAFKKLMNQDDESGGYKDFLMTDLAYEMTEKYQIFHTFGGHECVYFYGQNPLALRISGILTDDLDNDQFARMAQLYLNHLRGTQAARNYALVELALPNATFFGSITSIAFQQNAARDTDIGFTMGFLVRETIFRSTDVYFQNDSGEVTDYQDQNFLGTRDTPTLTQQEIMDKRVDQIAMIRADGSAVSNSEASSILSGKAGSLLALTSIYTSAIESIPSMKDLLGISPEDIASILTGWNNDLNAILSIPNAIINKVNSYADTAVSYLKTVEGGLDKIMGSITDTIGGALGAVQKVEDTIGTIINFPQSIASKIGGFLDNGLMTPNGANGSFLLSTGGGGGHGGSSDSSALLGGSRIDADTAGGLLSAGSRADPGPERGSTIVLTPVNVGITKNTDATATLPSGV